MLSFKFDFSNLNNQIHILRNLKPVKVKIKCTVEEGCLLKHYSWVIIIIKYKKHFIGEDLCMQHAIFWIICNYKLIVSVFQLNKDHSVNWLNCKSSIVKNDLIYASCCIFCAALHTTNIANRTDNCKQPTTVFRFHLHWGKKYHTSELNKYNEPLHSRYCTCCRLNVHLETVISSPIKRRRKAHEWD